MLRFFFICSVCFCFQIRANVDNREFTQLLVYKDSFIAELRTWPEADKQPKTLKIFRIGLGREVGDKQKEGDLKTPEGIYFTKQVLNKSDHFYKYGSLAITLDYPNPIDQMNKKSGSGIWLHGVGERNLEDKFITEGCVAFENDQLNYLSDLLQPQSSVVLVLNQKDSFAERSELFKIEYLTKQWSKSWAMREHDIYSSFYSSEFMDPKGNYKSYLDYKKNVFNRYKIMQVDLTNIRVIANKGYAVSVMSQDFKGDEVLRSKGTKILYWQKENTNSWKIVREIFHTGDFAPIPYNSVIARHLAETSEVLQ